MEAGPIKLLKLLGEHKSTFNIPVYQRNYEWTKDQVKQYFRDVEAILEENSGGGHFLGTIVFVSNEKPGLIMERIIIDGQQRITTTFLLLKAIYDLLDANNPAEKGRKEEIFDTYIINKFVDDQYKLKLKPVEDDRKAYSDLIESVPNAKESKVFTNYELFKTLINNSKYDPNSIFDALSLVEIVYISLDKNSPKENPQIIFESLNSTGLSLTEADLIRNFVLMSLDYDDQSKLYKKYWITIEKFLSNARISEFIRGFLSMKSGTTVNKQNVYSEFKKFYYKNHYSSEDILRELVKYAKYYHWFINLNSDIESINERLWSLQQLKSTVVYPYLLELFDDFFHKQVIDEFELIQTIELINSYLYRRAICAKPTNALNKVFASMAKNVAANKNAGKSHIDSVIDYLMSKDGSAIFPRNEEFKRHFVEFEIYRSRKDIATYTLYSIEKHFHKEVVENIDLTIEHIMPKVITPKWNIDLGRDAEEVHKVYKDTIGNLTLTKYNSEMSNKSFGEKKDFYANSNIKITRDINQYDNWNKESIIHRANKLFEIANEIWPMPVDNYKDTEGNVLQSSIEYSISENLNVTGYKPDKLIFDDEEIVVTTWKEMLTEMCLQLLDFDRELFYSLLQNNNYKKLISTNQENFRKPINITTDIYLETHFSAKDIYSYIQLLAKEYGVEEDVYFIIK